MRRGPEVSGWEGSLFPEPIDQVKVLSDRCVCHQDCPQYETCETEALDKSSKVYYLLRCVKGKFPACANCMCMACDRYQECKDGPEMGQRGGVRYRLCNRPISITGCLDYSGPIPWMSEAACKKCDHVCDLRKELVWAPRVRCDLNPIEPTKKPTEEPSAVQLDGKWRNISIIDNVVTVDGVICDDNFVPLTQPFPKPAKAKKPKPAVMVMETGGYDLLGIKGFYRCPLHGYKHLKRGCYGKGYYIDGWDAINGVWRCCQALESLGRTIEPDLSEPIESTKEPMAVLLDGKWYSDGKMLWDCSDCLCQVCANRGKSCHDCKGYEHCLKHGGKIGNCPDFRTEEGKEQHCLENGCLCFKCQLIGERCEDCPGPIRCDGPRMKCKEYVGAEVEA